jgi:hypothetical protein
MNAKRIIGALVEFMLGAVVLTYLGLHTINFFMFTFPPEQEYLAWLGFGLTGGAFIGYLLIFMWGADTDLKKTVALLMMVVSGIGEIAAAGFGMTIEAWSRMGWTMTQQDFDMMLLAIRVLAFAHALALAVYIAGDKIGELLGDHDGDGTPNFIDPDYKPAQKPSQNKRSVFGGLFGKRAPAPVQQHALDVGQTHIDIDGLLPDQHERLVKYMIEMKAQNEAAAHAKANGNGATDPTKAAR